MSRRLPRAFWLLAAAVAAAGAAHAAPSPFGIATPDSGGSGFGGPLGPLFIQISIYQQSFYRGLIDAMAHLKENGWAAWALIGLSFAYGVFHAAGPGHGKAVISGYLLASGETLRRGVLLSFAAAMVQAATAILVVAVAAVVFHATAMTMTAATDWFEVLSYGLIVAVGAWLTWTKVFGGHHHHHHAPEAVDAATHNHDNCEHEHDHHGHHHDRDHGHEHRRDDGARRASGSTPARAWSAILAVGMRPCSGALIVLVFALSQGLFLAGVVATLVMALGTGITVAALATLAVSAKSIAVRLAGAESPVTARLVHAGEIAASAAVLLLGLLLLGGALANGFPGA